jgi:tRNA(Glu) U13 pseudouridine synthase TruD
LVFERKILRRIFGHTKERDGTWRIKTNDELNKLIGSKAIINYIKSQRLGWRGHMHRMPDERIVKMVYEWKPMATSLLGRPQTRWENDVKNDLNTMKIYNWKDWHKWKKIVEKAKTFNE